ncbi:Uncharacterised protein [Mycobacteroides abscessus]|nr:Uncharacterised protein [Mycobacteroides abscessus]SKV62984.1 Uncharacterised protein [Mycobacteroides abscessus subsp. abscessus]
MIRSLRLSTTLASDGSLVGPSESSRRYVPLLARKLSLTVCMLVRILLRVS